MHSIVFSNANVTLLSVYIAAILLPRSSRFGSCSSDLRIATCSEPVFALSHQPLVRKYGHSCTYLASDFATVCVNLGRVRCLCAYIHYGYSPSGVRPFRNRQCHISFEFTTVYPVLSLVQLYPSRNQNSYYSIMEHVVNKLFKKTHAHIHTYIYI